MAVLNAIQSVLSIVFIIALGYFLTAKGWFDENISRLFSRLVVTVSLPAMMISNLLTTFDRSKLSHSGKGLLIPFMTMAVCYLVSMGIARLIKVRPERRGIFQAMFFASNTIFIGLPVNLALFGEKSVPYVLLYYAANTTMFWTIGIYGISKDGSAGRSGIFNLATLKRIFSPPLVGFLAGIILVLLEVRLPEFIMDSCKYLGNMTTPLSLLFIGITFYYIDFKSIKVDADMLAIMFGRFILSPALVFLVALPMHIPSLMLKVFVIQSAMPIITQSAIVTKAYNGDYKYATVMVTVSNIISMVFIPVYMGLLSMMK